MRSHLKSARIAGHRYHPWLSLREGNWRTIQERDYYHSISHRWRLLTFNLTHRRRNKWAINSFVSLQSSWPSRLASINSKRQRLKVICSKISLSDFFRDILVCDKNNLLMLVPKKMISWILIWKSWRKSDRKQMIRRSRRSWLMSSRWSSFRSYLKRKFVSGAWIPPKQCSA